MVREVTPTEQPNELNIRVELVIVRRALKTSDFVHTKLVFDHSGPLPPAPRCATCPPGSGATHGSRASRPTSSASSSYAGQYLEDGRTLSKVVSLHMHQ